MNTMSILNLFHSRLFLILLRSPKFDHQFTTQFHLVSVKLFNFMKSDWSGKQLWSNYLVRPWSWFSFLWNEMHLEHESTHFPCKSCMSEDYFAWMSSRKKTMFFSLLMVFFSAPFKWNSKFQSPTWLIKWALLERILSFKKELLDLFVSAVLTYFWP